MEKKCSVPGCERKHYAKGYCQAHWTRWRRAGDPGPAGFCRDNGDGICSVEACDRAVYGHRYCRMHYQRWRKHGDPSITLGPPRDRTPIPVGSCFGRLVVLGLTDQRRHGVRCYLVRCLGPGGTGHDSEVTRVVAGTDLRKGDVKSCGCLKRKYVRTEGDWSKHPLYTTFHSMHKRCEDPKERCFYRYGGRGIKVCERWSASDGFESFIADMGDKPSSKYSLERRDNDGSYSPENCYWATSKEQRANQRPRASLETLYRFGLREPLQELSVLVGDYPGAEVEILVHTDSLVRLGPFRAANTP